MVHNTAKLSLLILDCDTDIKNVESMVQTAKDDLDSQNEEIKRQLSIPGSDYTEHYDELVAADKARNVAIKKYKDLNHCIESLRVRKSVFVASRDLQFKIAELGNSNPKELKDAKLKLEKLDAQVCKILKNADPTSHHSGKIDRSAPYVDEDLDNMITTAKIATKWLADRKSPKTEKKSDVRIVVSPCVNNKFTVTGGDGVTYTVILDEPEMPVIQQDTHATPDLPEEIKRPEMSSQLGVGIPREICDPAASEKGYFEEEYGFRRPRGHDFKLSNSGNRFTEAVCSGDVDTVLNMILYEGFNDYDLGLAAACHIGDLNRVVHMITLGARDYELGLACALSQGEDDVVRTMVSQMEIYHGLSDDILHYAATLGMPALKKILFPLSYVGVTKELVARIAADPKTMALANYFECRRND